MLQWAVAGNINEPTAEPATHADISLNTILLNINIIWQQPWSLWTLSWFSKFFFFLSIGFDVLSFKDKDCGCARSSYEAAAAIMIELLVPAC